MQCLNCQKETKNLKFCSRSCSAITNNRIYPKANKKIWYCQTCKTIEVKRGTKYCKNCFIDYKKAIPSITILGNRTEYTCIRCKKTLSLDNFYIKRGRVRHQYCKKCLSAQAIERQRRFKFHCLEYKGSCCEICGYSKCINALEFHHRNPKEKEIAIGEGKTLSWKKHKERIKKELDKCAVLCSNCHREYHYNHHRNLPNPKLASSVGNH